LRFGHESFLWFGWWENDWRVVAGCPV
jgi:hypothetical protein